MAKFIVTSGTNFQPFSYQDLAAPVAQAAEIHRQTQDMYDTLGMETAALQSYIDNEPENSKARKMYQGYLDQLTALQDNLWNNGYNAQTRRDLAVAKSGFSNNILRLQKAVNDRDERSKEYWDTWHQNPDQVRGADPGQASLDDYLGNDQFGRNYYSYSGINFSKEVAAEAEARRKELLSNPEILSNGSVPGYITRLIKTGFTNEEVDLAYNAIKNAIFSGKNGEVNLDAIDPTIAALEKMDNNSATLARVLANQLESTGAYGNIDNNQLLRLLDYGHKGLSAAVGEPNIKDFDNKYFNQNLDLDTYYKKKLIDRALEKPGNGDGSGNPFGNGYVQNRTFRRLTSPNAAKMSSLLGQKFYKNYTDENGDVKPVELKLHDGTRVSATDAAEMSNYIYDTAPRRFIKEQMDLDIALPGYGGVPGLRPTNTKQISGDRHFMTTNFGDLTNEEKRQARADGYGPGNIIVMEYNDGWKYSPTGTYNYNTALDEHNGIINYTRELNKQDLGIDIDDYAHTPEELRDIKVKNGIEDVPDADVPTALKRLAVDELNLAPEIVSSGQQDDDKRILFARLIDDFWGNFDSNGKMGKSSQGAFYKISGGSGYASGAKGETNLANVFQLDNVGKINPACIVSITLMPRDIGGKEGTKFRIRVSGPDGHKTDWEMDSYALGEQLGAALNDPEFVSEMQEALKPYNDPISILAGSDKNAEDWANRMSDNLSYEDRDGSIFTRFPVSDGKPVSAKDILRDDSLYAYYYDAIVNFIQQYINNPIDMFTSNPRKHSTFTSKDRQEANLLGDLNELIEE